MSAMEPSDQSGPIEGRCVRRKSNGDPCPNYPMRGATICTAHGARNPAIARKALVRAELSDWGVTDEHVDPGETLLRLVSQSARRAEFYAGLLRQAYEAADAGEHDPFELPRGIKALIGKKYTVSAEGDAVETGEAIRGLVMLETAERSLCANFATKAIAAGLAERQVRVAEQTGAFLIAAVMHGLERAGLVGPALLEARNAVADYLEGEVV